MEKIILIGGANSGKTSTLTILRDNLIRKVSKGNIYTINIQKINLYPLERDFKCSLYYCGKKIAIYSRGDLPKHIIEAMNFAENEKADILVAAARTGVCCYLQKNWKHYCVYKNINSNTCPYKAANPALPYPCIMPYKIINKNCCAGSTTNITNECLSNIGDAKKIEKMIKGYIYPNCFIRRLLSTVKLLLGKIFK